MRIVYARQPFPDRWTSAVFLAGPTPRSAEVASWRPEALRLLREAGYDGAVFSPEDPSGTVRAHYLDQVEWERQGLELADVVLFWVPRELATMPAFTTNVEFGAWVASGKAVLGFPPGSPKNRYLAWLAGTHGVPVLDTLAATVEAALARINGGELRTDGERHVPLQVWRTPSFQAWYQAQQAVGNRLMGARMAWTFTPSRALQPFAWILEVQVHVAAEDRVKANEWVFARADLSATLLHGPVAPDPLDTEVVLIREFRAPVRTRDGFVHELPGGSSFEEGQTALQVAADEVAEEVGLTLSRERFEPLGSRQLAGTLSSHHGRLFRCALTDDELQTLRVFAEQGQARGLGSERAYVELSTVRALLEDERVDWATVGMAVVGLMG